MSLRLSLRRLYIILSVLLTLSFNRSSPRLSLRRPVFTVILVVRAVATAFPPSVHLVIVAIRRHTQVTQVGDDLGGSCPILA